MQAVLYVCHGSRTKEGRAEAFEFVNKAMQLIAAPIQVCCFLELAEPTIEQGFEQCIKKGADRVAVVPVLLLTAKHAKVDIPEQLSRLKQRYPSVEIRYGEPLGVQERIVEVLVERVKEQRTVARKRDILLIGRGSSDIQAVKDVHTIAGMLQRKIKHATVHVCFLAAAEPKFTVMLKKLVDERAENIVLIPYLLFNGNLMSDIRQTVVQLKLHHLQQVNICKDLGDHPRLLEALSQRAQEAIQSGKSVV